jgi:hypothetical protein
MQENRAVYVAINPSSKVSPDVTLAVASLVQLAPKETKSEGLAPPPCNKVVQISSKVYWATWASKKAL